MATTDHLGITLVQQSQAQKEVTVNAAFILLDALLNTGVIDKDLATPPGSPANGEVYIVAAGATDEWAGHSGHVAWYSQIWNFLVPNEGLTLWVNDEDLLYTYNGVIWTASTATTLAELSDTLITTPATYQLLQYDGTKWINVGTVDNIAGLGVNASADATNKLSVNSSAILFNHIGNGVQVKINKQAASDTASFLYQTNFSGRAEFGCIGDDHFSLKVSPDGSTFYSALKILNDSGMVAMKSIGTALFAAGSAQGDAAIIINQMNEFTTVGSGQGAILPSETGLAISVVNSGASTLRVYPSSGAKIDNLSTNAPYLLGVGARARFEIFSSTQIYSFLSA